MKGKFPFAGGDWVSMLSEIVALLSILWFGLGYLRCVSWFAQEVEDHVSVIYLGLALVHGGKPETVGGLLHGLFIAVLIAEEGDFLLEESDSEWIPVVDHLPDVLTAPDHMANNLSLIESEGPICLHIPL